MPKCNPNMQCSEEQKFKRRKAFCGCDCIFECQPYYPSGVIKKGEKRRADWYWTRIIDCPKHKELSKIK